MDVVKVACLQFWITESDVISLYADWSVLNSMLWNRADKQPDNNYKHGSFDHYYQINAS